MGLMMDRTSVAANARSANVLAGLLDELVTQPSIVRLYATASATGLRVSIMGAGAIVIDDQLVGAGNRDPLVPDDIIAEFGLTGPVDRLALFFRNTTGAAITAFWRVEVVPA